MAEIQPVNIKKEDPSRFDEANYDSSVSIIIGALAEASKDWLSDQRSTQIVSSFKANQEAFKFGVKESKHFDQTTQLLRQLIRDLRIRGGRQFASETVQQLTPDIEKQIEEGNGRGLGSAMQMYKELAWHGEKDQKKLATAFMTKNFVSWLRHIDYAPPGVFRADTDYRDVTYKLIYQASDDQLQQLATNILGLFKEDDLRIKGFSLDLANLFVHLGTHYDDDLPRRVDVLLKTVGIDSIKAFSAWDETCGKNPMDHYKRRIYAKNAVSIFGLEGVMPGSVKYLNEEAGIFDFARYPAPLLKAQFEQRNQTDVPYGEIFYPRNDWNGAYYQDSQVLNKLFFELQDLDTSIKVYEVEGRLDFIRRLNSARRKFGKSSFAIIGGHGNPHYIRLGDMESVANTEDAFNKIIHIDDLLPQGSSSTSLAFTEDPTIILVSCSTGTADGIGKRISELGATVIAPDKDTSLKDIQAEKDENGKLLFHVTYADDDTTRVFAKGSELKTSI